MSVFPHWDLTWLLGCPFCLSFTFLWRLKAWLQLEMGHTDCLKVSSHSKPSLRITCTWLNSLPGAGAGRNCFPSSAKWRIVPFPASSVSFYLGNSLTLPELNTSLVPLSLLQRLKETQHWSSGILKYLLLWTWWTYCVLQGHLQWQKGGHGDSEVTLQGHSSYDFWWGVTVVPMACPFTL